MTTPAVVDSVAGLRETVGAWRREGRSVALVPTMGALHEGHMALVRAARAEAERTVVSLFVNPTQFAPDEDFSLYPRSPADDLAALAETAVEAAFMPPAGVVYPPGFATRVVVDGVTAGLEGAARPHFFEGVATVVTKLLLQCLPDVALFGEKDYQQLTAVRRLVVDLDIPCRIEGVPTVRAADGLALSSRNAYLSAAERRAAPALFRVLSGMAAALAEGAPAADETAHGSAALRAAGFGRIDYLAVCDAETLAPVARVDAPARVLAAAWLGETRLIDNVPAAPAGPRRSRPAQAGRQESSGRPAHAARRSVGVAGPASLRVGAFVGSLGPAGVEEQRFRRPEDPEREDEGGERDQQRQSKVPMHGLRSPPLTILPR